MASEEKISQTGIFLIPRSPLGVFFEGMGIVALGVVLVAWPDITINVIRYAFGIFATVFAAIQIVYFASTKHEHKWWSVPLAIISFAAGVTAILWANATFAVIVFILGAWFSISGLILIAAGIKLPEEISARWIVAAVGALSFGFGVFLLARSFYSSAEEIVSWVVVLTGIVAIVEGLLISFYSLLLRRVIKDIESR